MQKLKKNKTCACSRPAIGRRNGAPVCEVCAKLEENLSKVADGRDIIRRAKPLSKFTLDMMNRKIDEWEERRGYKLQVSKIL